MRLFSCRDFRGPIQQAVVSVRHLFPEIYNKFHEGSKKTRKTDTKGNQNSLLFNHMGDPSGYMSNPTVDRLKIAVEEVYTSVDVCNKNAMG